MTQHLFSLLILSSINFAHAAYDPKVVKCPAKATEKVWQKNYDRCLEPFTKDVQGINPKKELGEKACNCVARELMSMTCEQIEKLEKSKPAEQDKMLADLGIVEKCIKEVGPLKK